MSIKNMRFRLIPKARDQCGTQDEPCYSEMMFLQKRSNLVIYQKYS